MNRIRQAKRLTKTNYRAKQRHTNLNYLTNINSPQSTPEVISKTIIKYHRNIPETQATVQPNCQ